MDRHAFLPPLARLSVNGQTQNEDRRKRGDGASNDEYTYVLHLLSSAASCRIYEDNTVASPTSPAHTTSNFGDFLDGFLSGTHLVVEVQHILLRL